MTEIITTRKCEDCKKDIVIDINNINDVVSFKKKYYHLNCFCQLANKKAQSSHKKTNDWEYALEHIEEFEQEAKDRLQLPIVRDSLSFYLRQNYNVTVVPDRFWLTVTSLSKGNYKKKKCNPVPVKLLLEVWKWGQPKLNKIAKDNKQNHKGPTNDEERIMYDLAILVRKIPNYLAHKAKMEMLQEETRQKANKTNIDYNSVQTNQNNNHNNNGLDDISSLLDEI